MTTPDMSATSDFGHIFTTPRVFHTLEILDDACTTFKSEHVILIRAQLRSRFFLRRFMWSGSDDDDAPELDTTFDMWGHPKHKVHGPLIREGRWRIVVVDLGGTFEVGDEDTLHFRHHLRDLTGRFEPFLGHTPKLGTEYLKLQVVLPASVSQDVFFAERTSDTEMVTHTEPMSGELLDDGRTRFSKEIHNPIQRNRGYRICWKRPSK